MSYINCSVLPTGGIINLTIGSSDAGPWTLARSIQGSTAPPVTLYTGPPAGLQDPTTDVYCWKFLDYGDGALPLNTTKTFTYTLTTASETVTSDPVQPACGIQLEYDDITAMIVKVMQAGMNSIVPPDGLPFADRPTVITAMPLTGQPKMPLVSINPTLLQQGETPIGHGVNTDSTTNSYTISELAHRRYTISVLSMSQQERDFLTMAVISIFKAVLIPLFEEAGQNNTSRYQVSSSQVVGDTDSPGFYFSEIGLDLKGVLVVMVNTNYGIMAEIDTAATGETGLTDTL